MVQLLVARSNYSKGLFVLAENGRSRACFWVTLTFFIGASIALAAIYLYMEHTERVRDVYGNIMYYVVSFLPDQITKHF